MNEMYLSVSEVNEIIKNMLDNEPRFSSIMVCGELSNYKIYPSGHHYFTLKDGRKIVANTWWNNDYLGTAYLPDGTKVILTFKKTKTGFFALKSVNQK